MTYGDNLLIFYSMILGVILVPGLDTMYVVSNSLTRGRAAGLAATGGLVLGGMIHAIYSCIAVSVLTTLIPSLLGPIAIVGALYMSWLGMKIMWSASEFGGSNEGRSRSFWKTAQGGATTSLLNPNNYFMALAIYPQYLRPEFGALGGQAAVMATLTAVTQIAVYGAISTAIDKIRTVLSRRSAAVAWAVRACGALILCLAASSLWRGLLVG